ncbi:MAG: transglutaminase domain-containing protein [Aristaeellaceae bacterium]
MRKLLLLLALGVTLAGGARAETELPYARSMIPGYMALNGQQRTLFDAAYAAALTGETEVDAPRGMAFDDAVAAMDLLLNECPELCALDDRCRVRYASNAPEVAIGVTLVYARALETQDVLLAEAQAMAAQATGTAWERELTLHDLLCDAAEYDLEAPNQQTAYGALVDGRAGCSGYARALTLLCRLAGIPCQTISGTATADGAEARHTWCVLYIGGAFAQTDPTWNDQDGAGVNTHWYFNLTDGQMAADHCPDAGTLSLPCTDESLSWHARRGLIVPAREEDARQVIDDALYALATRGDAVNLRFEDTAAAQDFVQRTSWYLAAYNEAHPQARCDGGYQLMHSAEQGCVMLLAAW